MSASMQKRSLHLSLTDLTTLPTGPAAGGGEPTPPPCLRRCSVLCAALMDSLSFCAPAPARCLWKWARCNRESAGPCQLRQQANQCQGKPVIKGKQATEESRKQGMHGQRSLCGK
jgi:hypothetical protein